LRVRNPLYLAAEGAVVVDAHRAGEEEAIVVRELLLAVEAEGVVLRPILEWLRKCPGGGDRLETRRRKEVTLGLEVGVVVRVILHAARGLRAQVRPWFEVERAGVVVGVVRGLVLVVEPIA